MLTEAFNNKKSYQTDAIGSIWFGSLGDEFSYKNSTKQTFINRFFPPLISDLDKSTFGSYTHYEPIDNIN